MTREKARKAAEVMMAYAERKEIEVFDECINDWDKTDNPNFNWGINVYRIKPEPTYRPFKNKEECWNEMQKHQPFGWVIDKESKTYHNTNSIVSSGEEYFKRMMTIMTFADGTPFGIKDE